MRAALLALAGLALLTAGLTLCPWLGLWAGLLVDGALVLWLGLNTDVGRGAKPKRADS